MFRINEFILNNSFSNKWKLTTFEIKTKTIGLF